MPSGDRDRARLWARPRSRRRDRALRDCCELDGDKGTGCVMDWERSRESGQEAAQPGLCSVACPSPRNRRKAKRSLEHTIARAPSRSSARIETTAAGRKPGRRRSPAARAARSCAEAFGGCSLGEGIRKHLFEPLPCRRKHDGTHVGRRKQHRMRDLLRLLFSGCGFHACISSNHPPLTAVFAVPAAAPGNVAAAATAAAGNTQPTTSTSTTTTTTPSALPYDLVMPALRNLSGDPDYSGLIDISKSTCWVGEFTADSCCREFNPNCWDEHMTIGECCPNSDCWEGAYNYEYCCAGEGGNPGCWGDVYNYARCCALTEPSTSWVDNLFNGQSTESFYSFDEFYNDAQYGPDFGYYSTGRVMGAGKLAPDANEFAHFTTFPMAIAPHFGRVLMRSVFLMWRRRKRELAKGTLTVTKVGEEDPGIFQVVEMGAGSGQLGKDIRDCVLENCLGLSPELDAEWKTAFRYTILERSPALAKRQRERGLEVIVQDAQTVAACEVLKTQARRDHFTADVVISNELIDAFAPVKLKLSVFDLENVDPGKCSSWTEMKLLHLIKIQDVTGLFAQQLGIREPSKIVSELQAFTDTFFCTAMQTSVGQAAMSVVPRNTTCMNTVLALSNLMETSNLQIPAASNNVRLRLKKDPIVQGNLRKLVRELEKELNGFLAIPRNIYQELRRGLKDRGNLHENLDVTFLIASKTKRLSVPISPDRCRSAGIGSFLRRHTERNRRLAKFYHDLGYPSLYVVMRPGEEEFLKLTNCLIRQDVGGHVLTIDYGASYEPLANSLSVDPGYDGIFVPPIPHHLMEELPHCHGDWTACAGRIDWTTFVDFTNMAAAGLELGYETVWYGPQSFLEQMSASVMPSAQAEEPTYGYSTLENVDWINRHAINWYGPEKAEPWQQRWTGFKALLQRVPPSRVRAATSTTTPQAHLPGTSRTGVVPPPTARLSVPVEDTLPKTPLLDAAGTASGAANSTITSTSAATGGQTTETAIASATSSSPVVPQPASSTDYYDIVAFPTWHLDSTEVDPCWLFDPTNMPIADWSKINSAVTNATTRQVLSQLSVDVDRALGERYAMGYEDAQLSVRLVDFLVKAQGCKAMANPGSISLKWKPWMRARWSSVWKEEVLDRVGPAVMSMLRLEAAEAASPTPRPRGRHYPYECAAAQTFRAMCGHVLGGNQG